MAYPYGGNQYTGIQPRSPRNPRGGRVGIRPRQEVGGGHSSITDYDPYTGAVIHTNTQGDMDRYLAKRRKNYEDLQLQRRMDQYDAQSGKYLEQLQNLYGMRADRSAAQQVGAAAQGIQRGLLRGGLEGGGLSQSILSRERSKVLGEATGAKMNFSQALLSYQQEARDRVLTGELDYFNEIERMRINENLEEKFARFQSQLAKDEQSRNSFLGMLSSIGGLASLFIPGAGPVVAAGSGINAASQIYDVSSRYQTPTFNPSMRTSTPSW